MMIDENLARIRTHRSNIARYWRLLRSELSDFERSSIERRLAEERASLNALAAKTFPLDCTADKAITIGISGLTMPQTRIPPCPECGAPSIWLRSTPEPLGYVTHAYECPKCAFIQTSVEKVRLDLEGGWIVSELEPPAR